MVVRYIAGINTMCTYIGTFLEQCPVYKMREISFWTRLMVGWWCLQSSAVHKPITALVLSSSLVFLAQVLRSCNRVGACCSMSSKTACHVNEASLEWGFPCRKDCSNSSRSSWPIFDTMCFLSDGSASSNGQCLPCFLVLVVSQASCVME